MTTMTLRHSAIILAAGLSLTAAASEITIEVAPGALKSTLASTDTIGMTELVITGKLDVRDLNVAARLPLQRLDLSKARILGISSQADLLYGRHYFSDDDIPGYVFFQSPLVSVILPESTKTIGEAAFASSAIESVTLPEGLSEIGDYAFRDCSRLTGIAIPASVATLGDETFYGCSSLSRVTFAEGSRITDIPARTFAQCTSLTSVVLPEGVTHIGELVIGGSAVRSVRGNGAVNVDPFALAEAPALEYPNVDIKATSTAEGVFLNDVLLKSPGIDYTSIPAATFAGAAMVDATEIMKGATSVGDFAFYGFPFEQVTLSEGIASLGHGVFGNAEALSRIFASELNDNVPEVDGHTFDGLDREKVKIVVLHKYADVWKSAPYWNEFEILDEYSGIDEVFGRAFSLRYADGKVILTASEEIADVMVADEGGRILASAQPSATQVEIPVAAAGVRILIVNSLIGDRRRSDKIIIPAS